MKQVFWNLQIYPLKWKDRNTYSSCVAQGFIPWQQNPTEKSVGFFENRLTLCRRFCCFASCNSSSKRSETFSRSWISPRRPHAAARCAGGAGKGESLAGAYHEELLSLHQGNPCLAGADVHAGRTLPCKYRCVWRRGHRGVCQPRHRSVLQGIEKNSLLRKKQGAPRLRRSCFYAICNQASASCMALAAAMAFS